MGWFHSDFEGVFVPREYATIRALIVALDHDDEELLDLARETAIWHFGHFLRYEIRDDEQSQQLLHSTITQALTDAALSYDDAAVERALVVAEDITLTEEIRTEARFWALLNEQNDTVASHTDGQGVNCVYGTALTDYWDSTIDIEEDDVINLGERAAAAIISGEADRHVPLERPWYCAP